MFLSQQEQGMVSQKTQAIELRCEFLDNPIGIDVTRPRLSWKLNDKRPDACQTAYRIIAATTKKA